MINPNPRRQNQALCAILPLIVAAIAAAAPDATTPTLSLSPNPSSLLQSVTPFTSGTQTTTLSLSLNPSSLPPPSSAAPRDPRYPAHWWAPVDTATAPDWEILPQQAAPGEVILSKRNELGLLSNFAATSFTLDSHPYASVEGFWQMMLYPESPTDPRATAPGIQWQHTRDEVAAMVAFPAKAAGDAAWDNMKKIGIDYVTYQGKQMPYYHTGKADHYNLIVRAMRAKLDQNPQVKQVLLATGDLKLRPDHHQPPDAPPSWHYHEIWMDLRGELQQGKR